MSPVSLECASLLVGLCSPDPATAMEAAKSLISWSGDPGVAALIGTVARDRKYPKSARIAAIFAMGFFGDPAGVESLVGILRRAAEPASIRDYAAEALGNRRASKATAVLARVGTQAPRQSDLRRSCVYALQEIGTVAAKRALANMASKKR